MKIYTYIQKPYINNMLNAFSLIIIICDMLIVQLTPVVDVAAVPVIRKQKEPKVRLSFERRSSVITN